MNLLATAVYAGMDDLLLAITPLETIRAVEHQPRQ